MTRDIQHMPYGYEPPANERKGTLIFYDSFEHISDMELLKAAETAVDRRFMKLVLYPLHEETVRRMTKEPVKAWYKRDDRLHEWKKSRDSPSLPWRASKVSGRSIPRWIRHCVISVTSILHRIFSI